MASAHSFLFSFFTRNCHFLYNSGLIFRLKLNVREPKLKLALADVCTNALRCTCHFFRHDLQISWQRCIFFFFENSNLRLFVAPFSASSDCIFYAHYFDIQIRNWDLLQYKSEYLAKPATFLMASHRRQTSRCTRMYEFHRS